MCNKTYPDHNILRKVKLESHELHCDKLCYLECLQIMVASELLLFPVSFYHINKNFIRMSSIMLNVELDALNIHITLHIILCFNTV